MCSVCILTFDPVSSGVLTELVESERDYTHSVERLATSYYPMFSLRTVPTFLQGQGNTVLSNITQIHLFHRYVGGCVTSMCVICVMCGAKLYPHSQFSAQLCRHDNTVQSACEVFLQSQDQFQCYIPFILGLERGLEILSEYGGSFFADKQVLLGDQRGILDHCYRVKERLVEYDHFLRQLVSASQKQALHAVDTAKVIDLK